MLLSSVPGEKRIVLNISQHKSQNYMVIPRYCNSFLISNSHYLPIVLDQKLLLMNIKNYPHVQNKNEISLVHEQADFSAIHVYLEPHILGIWLNNYCNTSSLKFLKKNVQVTMSLLNFVDKFALEYINDEEYIEIIDNRFIAVFHNYNLFMNPRIPEEYKYNKKSIRSRLLSGFLDNNESSEIEIDNKTLKDDFCFLVHSLGLLTSTKKKNSKWYVSVLYSANTINDFRIAKIDDDDCLCLQISGTSVGIFLPDFTMI